MESGEGQGLKQSPPPESKLARARKKMLGPALVAASFIAGLGGGKANTQENYSPDTSSPAGITQALEKKVVVPGIARDGVSVEQEKTPVSFANVMQGTDSKFTEASNIVISDQASWTEYWNMINQDPNRPLPEIDFSKDMLILTAQGQSSGGRNMVEVKNINEEKGVISVRVESTIPNASCTLLPQDTSPYQIVSIPKTDNQIEFEIVKDEGCYAINVATSAHYDPKKGTVYSPQTVTKTPIAEISK